MARITLEQKFDAVFRYDNGEESLTSIAKSLNLTTTEMLNFWIEKNIIFMDQNLLKRAIHVIVLNINYTYSII